MTSTEQLNERYAIPGRIRFRETADGVTVIELNNAHASASISLQGGHLLSWTPNGQQPVIWMSEEAVLKPGKSIRGGIPVCWPWFGAHAEHPDYPAHGFVRTAAWQVVESGSEDHFDRVTLSPIPNEAAQKYWPYASELLFTIRVGETLDLEMLTRNTGNEAFTLGEALHTYFAVHDVRQISVQGLDGHDYLDKVGPEARRHQEGSIRFSGEVDRIYLDAPGDCLIEDPGLGRRIRISKQGSRSTVVWNPWIEKSERLGDMGKEGYLGMVCVESTNAAQDVVNIEPGGEHRLSVRYQVEGL